MPEARQHPPLLPPAATHLFSASLGSPARATRAGATLPLLEGYGGAVLAPQQPGEEADASEAPPATVWSLCSSALCIRNVPPLPMLPRPSSDATCLLQVPLQVPCLNMPARRHWQPLLCCAVPHRPGLGGLASLLKADLLEPRPGARARRWASALPGVGAAGGTGGRCCWRLLLLLLLLL